MATRVDEEVAQARAAVARLGEAVRAECAAAVGGLPPVWLASVTAAGVSVTLRDPSWSADALGVALTDGHGWTAGYRGVRAADGAADDRNHATPAAAVLALRAHMGDRWPWGRE